MNKKIKKGEGNMKKEYGTPKAEKVTFDYSEVVVASNTAGCYWVQPDSHDAQPCNEQPEGDGHYNEAPVN